MTYRFEWLYSDLNAGQQPADLEHFDIHFNFLLRFQHIPPGKGHVAHFAFNVLSPEAAEALGVDDKSRGFLICETFCYEEIVSNVEQTVADIFDSNSHSDALEILNGVYIHEDLDFSSEFAADLKSAVQIIELIEKAFANVTRGSGITLHEAVAIDNYASDAEIRSAGELDTDTSWRDVPTEDIASNPQYMTFLDSEGFRYYLPANMSWSIRNYSDDPYDSAFFTYLKLFPTVAPREVGRGLGDKFDVQEFSATYSFSKDQVSAIYHFLCFMAIQAEMEIDEDKYPAMLGWRDAASNA